MDRIKVGSIDPNGAINREWFGQGYVFKDGEAYLHRPTAPCYVSELSDEVYTAEDFLQIAGGDIGVADYLFYYCDWQSPYAALEDLISGGDIVECFKCRGLYVNSSEDIEGISPCPYCGAVQN